MIGIVCALPLMAEVAAADTSHESSPELGCKWGSEKFNTDATICPAKDLRIKCDDGEWTVDRSGNRNKACVPQSGLDL
jgi:hypothetical protein